MILFVCSVHKQTFNQLKQLSFGTIERQCGQTKSLKCNLISVRMSLQKSTRVVLIGQARKHISPMSDLGALMILRFENKLENGFLLHTKLPWKGCFSDSHSCALRNRLFRFRVIMASEPHRGHLCQILFVLFWFDFHFLWCNNVQYCCTAYVIQSICNFVFWLKLEWF